MHNEQVGSVLVGCVGCVACLWGRRVMLVPSLVALDVVATRLTSAASGRLSGLSTTTQSHGHRKAAAAHRNTPAPTGVACRGLQLM